MSVTSPRPDPATTTARDTVVYGPIHLDISDRDRSVGFWAGLVGLQTLSSSADEIRLGVDDRELLVLHPGATGPSLRGHSGLYHLALHLPSEAEFARVLLRIAQAGYPQSPTDHIMHWASYLDDPDGIGLELSFETLDRFGHHAFAGGRPIVVDRQGAIRSAAGQLDLEAVISHLHDRDLTRPLPARTRVGHIHLHVSDIDDAVAFYKRVAGFTANVQEPLFGMADFGAGGSFPHRLAVNVWQGRGAQQRPAGTAGLRHFELRLRSGDALAGALSRYESLTGAQARDHPDGQLLADPSGNTLTLSRE